MLFWMGATCSEECQKGMILKRIAMPLTTKLLTRICKILALRLVLPRNSHCSIVIMTWPSGALMKAPYRAILGTRDVK